MKKLEALLPKQGLKLWLRADAGVLLNGTKVMKWQDQSGQGCDAAASVNSSQPEYVDKQGNGLPALRFDGNSDCLDSTCVPATGAAPRTLVAVLNDARVAGSPYRIALSYGVRRKAGTYTLATAAEGHDQLYITYHDGRMQSSQTITRDTLVVVCSYDGKTDRMFVNGAEKASQSIKLDTGDKSPLRIGAQISVNKEWYKGSVCEVFAYASALSPQERQAVESYLMLKYGVTPSKP